MEILGIGPLEILLVIVLALVVLGPQDMVSTARKMGVWIRKIARSELWREIMDTSREIRQIPTTLIRDSGLEETARELRDTGQMVRAEVGQATQELSSEMQQATSDLSAEVEQANQALTAQADSAQPAPDGAEPPVEPQEVWVEAQGNQPHPFPPGDYPQVYPVESSPPPEEISQPPDKDE